MAKIDARHPKWHDRKVLISRFRVGKDNYITFSQAPKLAGIWYIAGDAIRKYPLVSGGKNASYVVPLDELQLYIGEIK